MIVITTMNSLPEHCYECPCYNGEHGYCQADEKHISSDYRPFGCPLKKQETIMHCSKNLWSVKYTVRNKSPKRNEKSCLFGDGTLYIEANNIFDAIEKAHIILKQFGFDTVDINGCHYGQTNEQE